MNTEHEYIVQIKVAKPEDIEAVYDAIGNCDAVVEYCEMAEWNIAEMEAEEAESKRQMAERDAQRRVRREAAKARKVASYE